jgi:hypothetical protein
MGIDSVQRQKLCTISETIYGLFLAKIEQVDFAFLALQYKQTAMTNSFTRKFLSESFH